MTAVLVAIYLHGAASVAATPGTIERAEYPMPTLAECRAAARQMVERAKVGRMRAFCRSGE